MLFFSQIRENPRQRMGWIILVTFTIIQSFLQGSIGLLSLELEKTFSLDEWALGILSSCFFYTYLLFQIPAGWIIDSWGIKKTTSLALGILGLCCLGFSLSQNLFQMEVARVCMGAVSAFAFLGVLKSVTLYFPKNWFPWLLSISGSLSMLGTGLANWAFASSVTRLGWRVSFSSLGEICLCLAFGILWTFQKEEMKKIDQALENQETAKWTFLRWPSFWMSSFAGGSLFSLMSVFSMMWAISFFREMHGWDLVTSTRVTSWSYYGFAVGSLIMGFWTHIVKPARLLWMSSLAVWPIYTILIYIFVDPFYLKALMFCLGFICSGYLSCFSFGQDCIPPSLKGMSFGCVNFMVMALTLLGQPMVGFLLAMEHGASHRYTLALGSLMGFLLLGTIFSFFLQKKTENN